MSVNPEVTVRRLIAELRVAGLHPGVASNHIAEGVLHDVGWALWEAIPNPSTGSLFGGGYAHALFHVEPATYESDRVPLGRTLNLRWEEVVWLKRILANPYVNLLPAEWPDYVASATSVCTQQMVLSPVHIGGGTFTFYRYPELQTLVTLARASGLRVYANVGMANNEQFWTGEYEFNRVYALKTNRRTNPPLLARITPDDFVVITEFATPLASQPLDTRPWYHTVYDPTHPDVVRLCVDSIRHLARTYPSVRLVLGGESGIDFSTCPPGEVLGPSNCARCAPMTNFSPTGVAGFRKFMERVQPEVHVFDANTGATGFTVVDARRAVA